MIYEIKERLSKTHNGSIRQNTIIKKINTIAIIYHKLS